MPRNGALTFRDIAGKREWLRLECPKCGRAGRYSVRRLIERRGLDASMIDWRLEVTADCPKLWSANIYDRCGAVTPDLVALFPRPAVASATQRGEQNASTR